MYGAKQASLEIFRRFLQKLSDADINYGMERRVIREEDLLNASVSGDLHLSVADKAMRILAGLGRPSLLFKLKTVADFMGQMKLLYKRYPATPEGLERWKAEVKELIERFEIALR
jgi:hypothetical protein